MISYETFVEIVSWIMIFTSMVACFLNANRNRYSMLLYTITACWWAYYNLIVIDCLHQGLLRLFYFINAIYGFNKWKQLENKDKKDER